MGSVEDEQLIRREFADDEAFLTFLEQSIHAVLKVYRKDASNFHSLILREGKVFASEHPDSPFRFEIRKKIVNDES